MMSWPSEITSQMRLVGIESIAALVHVGQLHRLADADGAGVGLSPGR